MALGKQIRIHRAALGLTLEQLSDLCGVDVGTISALENRDSARSKYASAIAKGLGMTVEELEAETEQRARATARVVAIAAHDGPEIVAVAALMRSMGAIGRARVLAYAQGLAEQAEVRAKRCPVIPIRPTPCRTVPPSAGVPSDEIRPSF